MLVNSFWHFFFSFGVNFLFLNEVPWLIPTRTGGISTCTNGFVLIILNGSSITLEEVEREMEVFSDLSRLRRIHVSGIKFLLGIFSVVPALFHMVLNPIHQFSLRLSSDAVACFEVIVGGTLVNFVGFVVVMVSLGDSGEILSDSIVHPSTLETVFPPLAPKTRWGYANKLSFKLFNPNREREGEGEWVRVENIYENFIWQFRRD